MFAAAQLPGVILWYLAAGLAFLLAALFWLRRHKSKTAGGMPQHKGNSRWLPLLLCAALAALLLNRGFDWLVMRPIRRLDGHTCRITARVQDVAPGYGGDTAHATLQVLEVDGVRRTIPFKLELRGIPQPRIGDILQTEVRFYTYANRSTEARRAARGFYLAASATAAPEKTGYAPDWLGRMRMAQYALSANIRHWLPQRLSSVLAAMTVGDRRFLSDATLAAYRKAGLSHMLVVSGLHLSVLCGAFYSVLLKLFKRPRAAAVPCLALVVFFMAFTGFTPSIVRSGVVHLMVYAAPLFGRKADVFTSIGLAAVLLCTQNPYAATDIGLLLSFTATLGALAGGQLNTRVRRRYSEKPARGPALLGRWLLRAALVPLAVTFATLPVLIWAGMGVSLPGVLANVIAVPLLAPIMVAGFVMAIPAGIPLLNLLPQLASLVAGTLLMLLERLTSFCASLPFGYIAVGGLFAFIVVLLLYATVALGVRTRRYAAFSMVTAGILLLSVFLHLFLTNGTVTVAVAGSGADPSLVVMQNGRAVVLYRSRNSAAAVERVLWEHNVRECTLLLDMRRTPYSTEYDSILYPKEIVIARLDVFSSKVFSPFGQVDIYLKNQSNGSFVCVDVAGYKIVLASGSVDMREFPPVDLLLAGSGRVQGLYSALLATGTPPAWANPQAKLLLGGEVRLQIRPQQSVKYREVYGDGWNG